MAMRQTGYSKDPEKSGVALNDYQQPPDTSKYAIPINMPTWAKWLLALNIVALIGLVAGLAMLLVVLIKGDALGDTVHEAQSSLQDLSALESVMPMILHILQAFYNSTSGTLPQSFSTSGFDDPVPQLNYVTILNDTTRIAYRYRGVCEDVTSEVVVLVHALSSSSVEWLSEMLRYAKDEKCAIALDLIGHGNSDPLDGALGGTVTNHAIYLFEFLYKMGIVANASRSVVMVGSGFGASVVVQLLDNYPGIADRAILVNAVPYVVKPGDPNATDAANTGAMSLNAVMQLAGLSLWNVSAYTTLVTNAIAQGSSCSPDAFGQVIDAYSMVAISADADAISQGLVSMASLDHTQAFERMIIPVMMITGARTGLESFSTLNYALLGETARDLVGRLASLHVFGAASAAVHITHGTLFHTLSQNFLSNLDSDCDLASIAWSQIE